MADIFISYKSEERALPEALASDLRAAGYSVWWDVDLVGGAAFRAQILEQLTAARAVIVIWTPASVRSEFVLDEADHAKREGKLIPVRAPELDPRRHPLGPSSGANLSLERASAHRGRVAGDRPYSRSSDRASAPARRDNGGRAAVAGGDRREIAGRRSVLSPQVSQRRTRGRSRRSDLGHSVARTNRGVLQQLPGASARGAA